MTTQFHEGQEVEIWKTVRRPGADYTGQRWCKAKIVKPLPGTPVLDPGYHVAQFRDGTRAVFDTAHIREIPNRDLAKMTPDELQEDVNDCYGSNSL